MDSDKNHNILDLLNFSDASQILISKNDQADEVTLTMNYALGTALGTVISILLTGLLAANLGWDSIFYVEGVLCLIWCVAWWLMIADSPEKQTRFISQRERNYIVMSLGGHVQDDVPKTVLKN